jgi:hypothetical protein
MPRHLTRLDAIDVNAVLFGVSKWFTGVHRKFLSHIGLSVVVADLSAGVYNVVYSFVWFPSRGIFFSAVVDSCDYGSVWFGPCAQSQSGCCE